MTPWCIFVMHLHTHRCNYVHVGTLIYMQKNICIHKIKPYTKIPLVSFAVILGYHIFASSFYSSHLKGWIGLYFIQMKDATTHVNPERFSFCWLLRLLATAQSKKDQAGSDTVGNFSPAVCCQMHQCEAPSDSKPVWEISHIPLSRGFMS